jgi:hypothetical protein
MIKNRTLVTHLVCIASFASIINTMASEQEQPKTLVLERSSEPEENDRFGLSVFRPCAYLFLAWKRMSDGDIVAYSYDGCSSGKKCYSYSKFLTSSDFQMWGDDEGYSCENLEDITKEFNPAVLRSTSKEETDKWRTTFGITRIDLQSLALAYPTPHGDRLAVMTPLFDPKRPRFKDGLPEDNILRIYKLPSVSIPTSLSLPSKQLAITDKSSDVKQAEKE